jgi:hypothetical protein
MPLITARQVRAEGTKRASPGRWLALQQRFNHVSGRRSSAKTKIVDAARGLILHARRCIRIRLLLMCHY